MTNHINKQLHKTRRRQKQNLIVKKKKKKKKLQAIILKPKLREEPSVLASPEPLFEPLLGLLSGGHLLVFSLQDIGIDHVLQIDIQRVPRRHQVAVIHQLYERLHARFLRRLFGRVLADHLRRVLRHAGDQAVPVRTVACAVVEGTDDHRLPSGVAAL